MRGGLCEEFPTCYVKEVPYMDLVLQGTCMVIEHHADIDSMEKSVGNADIEAVTLGEATTRETKVTPGEGHETPVPPSNRAMHGHIGAPPPFLHAGHLDLVFEL
jgi:hypothetical protein